MGDIDIIIKLNYILIVLNTYWIKTIISELSVRRNQDSFTNFQIILLLALILTLIRYLSIVIDYGGVGNFSNEFILRSTQWLIFQLITLLLIWFHYKGSE